MSKKDTSEKKEHYVDNKEFFVAMTDWKKNVIESENSGDTKPPVTDYIGKCFLDIATHLSYRPNFINYPYREEMIGDGIENCLMYAHNFNPEKSKNPFSYFTQIIYYAFLRRIEKEKKQNYIKYKLLENAEDDEIKSWCKENYFETSKMKKTDKEDEDKEANEILADHFRLNEKDIEKFTPKKKKNKTTKKKKNKKSNSLLPLLQDEENETGDN
jgi:hypothetical protein